MILAALLMIGFFYRLYGLSDNYSFWTDEDHVAIFARAILERGKPVLANGYHTGIYQWLQYWLSAISAKIFGLNEFAIRFPSVIFGTLTIWAVYLLGKKLFSQTVGLTAAILTTFLKIEILWSRQARPYQALQFFYLLSAYFLYQQNIFGFLVAGVLASLMHRLGLGVFLSGFLYLLLFRFSWLKKQRARLGAIFLVILFSIYSSWPGIKDILLSFNKVNNSFYYRVFLWHHYSLLVFLSLVGVLDQVFQKKNSWKILVLFLAIQGMIASFFLTQPFVRYFYLVLPFLVLLTALGLVRISRQTSNFKHLTLIILVFFILGLGHKFTLKLRRVYSLNEDMQELPEVDWKKIYHFVDQKLSQDQETVLVTNWNDLPIWFLGEGKLDYLTRLPRKERLKRDPLSSSVLIYSLDEFENAIENQKKGILVIDSWDDMVPEGIREYSRQNFKKELEVDRLYSIQPRLWPVEVYSWGI